eukprot:scaffold12831_cov129-Isochrysis_galbana.AAC.3
MKASMPSMMPRTISSDGASAMTSTVMSAETYLSFHSVRAVATASPPASGSSGCGPATCTTIPCCITAKSDVVTAPSHTVMTERVYCCTWSMMARESTAISDSGSAAYISLSLGGVDPASPPDSAL